MKTCFCFGWSFQTNEGVTVIFGLNILYVVSPNKEKWEKINESNHSAKTSVKIRVNHSKFQKKNENKQNKVLDVKIIF